MLRAGQMVVDDIWGSKSERQWYLIHHSTGGKFHVVMNSAAHYRSTSLNENLLDDECMRTGLEHTSTLHGMLLRFRQVAFMADIKLIHLQCWVIEQDQQTLKFLCGLTTATQKRV